MNEPNVPDNSRDWDSIDIFLFSNGQQYSPPRKYHLLSDDLKWWDTTKTFLARSQYGSMHSAIDLYSLDGKKIEGPLELRNVTAYVAVEPPDTFIPAGYEKYLFKASRSWEKRQEKLANSNEIEKTDKTGIHLDITRIEQIEEIVSLKMAENSTPIQSPANIFFEPQKMTEKPTFSKLKSAKIGKLCPKNKSNDFEKSAFLKKKNLCSSTFQNNDHDCMKTKNISLKPQKRNNKEQAMSAKYSRRPKTSTQVNSIECKANSKTSNRQISEIVNDIKLASKILNNTNDMNENFKKFSNKELEYPVVSNVYKNYENDVQSIILETDRTTTIDNNSTESSLELNKDNKHVIEEQIQNYTVSMDNDNNNKEKLNIKLRIKLEDLTSSMTSENDYLKHNRSFITLIKKEKASQVNIDVILSKDIFTFNKNLFLNEKSIVSNTTKNEDYLRNDQEIFVRYNLNPKLNGSFHKNVLELPTEIIENLLDSCKCKSNQPKIEMVDKGIQKSVSSINNEALSPNKIINGKSENMTKNKFSVLKEDPREIKQKKQTEFQDDMIPKGTEIFSLSSKVFDEKNIQTEWCNVLLQANIHEDGRYTFHLPALSLLKQYNIDQM